MRIRYTNQTNEFIDLASYTSFDVFVTSDCDVFLDNFLTYINIDELALVDGDLGKPKVIVNKSNIVENSTYSPVVVIEDSYNKIRVVLTTESTATPKRVKLESGVSTHLLNIKILSDLDYTHNVEANLNNLNELNDLAGGAVVTSQELTFIVEEDFTIKRRFNLF